MNAKNTAAELEAMIGYYEHRIGPINVMRLRVLVRDLVTTERRRAVRLLRKEWDTLADKDAAWADKLAKLIRNG